MGYALDDPGFESREGQELFLGAFTKLKKATIMFIMSVRQFAWNNSALTGRICLTFDI
jgi:hypothetical protein